MNREEIRKKWKNRELAEISQNKLARQEETQNPNLYKQTFGLGNINLRNRPVVKNSDGSISTVRSMSFYDDDEKKEILVPTVVGGKIVSDREAIDNYYKTGQYLGKFDTPEDATDYALKLHDAQDKYYNKPNVQQTSINSSSWERVQNTANKILSNPSQMTGISNVKNAKSTSFLENRKRNLSSIANNFGLGVKDSGIDLAYMIDRQTYRNSPEYKSINKRQQAQEEKIEQLDKLKQGLEGKASFTPTAENLRKTKTKTVGLIPQRDTKETTVFQRGANRILEQDEQKIQKNIDSTTNKVAKKVAELTPSMAQSATGMAISALNPVLRNRVFYGKCWRWIYKTSFGYGL